MTVIRQLTRTDNDPSIPGRVEATCDWVRANGLDPKEVAACVGEVILTVEEVNGERIIRYQRFVRSATGGIQVDPRATVDRVWTEEVTVPLVVPMPESWDA